MSHWNYRVLKKPFNGSDDCDYGIIEVYYTDSGDIRFWTKEFMDPSSDTVDGIKQKLEWMAVALTKPVLIEVEKDDGLWTLIEVKQG